MGGIAKVAKQQELKLELFPDNCIISFSGGNESNSHGSGLIKSIVSNIRSGQYPSIAEHLVLKIGDAFKFKIVSKNINPKDQQGEVKTFVISPLKIKTKEDISSPNVLNYFTESKKEIIEHVEEMFGKELDPKIKIRIGHITLNPDNYTDERLEAIIRFSPKDESFKIATTIQKETKPKVPPLILFYALNRDYQSLERALRLEPESLEKSDKYYKTPLHCAIRGGDPKIVKLLLEKIDIKAITKEYKISENGVFKKITGKDLFAKSKASSTERDEILKLLLAKKSEKESKPSSTTKTKKGEKLTGNGKAEKSK